MTTITASRGTAGNLTVARPSGALRAVPAAFAHWWSAWQERRWRQANEALLRSLDDRTLKDIGIERSEIGSLFAPDTSDRVAARRVRSRRMRNL